MVAISTGSAALIGVAIAVAVTMLGGLVHVVYRLGQAAQRITHLEGEAADLKDDLRYLAQRLGAGKTPSARREEDEWRRST